MSIRLVLVPLAVGALLSMAAPAIALPEGSTVLVSRPAGFGPLPSGGVNHSWLGIGTGNQNRGPSSVSTDGRYVAFTSESDGLSSEDDNRYANVYVRDVLTGTTKLVSRATGATGAAADFTSYAASISDDGTRVAFVSGAKNLATGVTGEHVYVRDLSTDTTTLVSRADGAAGVVGNNWSGSPAISGDGSRVAFHSQAINLDAADTTGGSDVYVRILATHDTVLVSRATGAAGAIGNGASYNPAINGNGTIVAFETDATNFDASDTNAERDIYRRSTAANTTVLVSRAPGAAGAVGGSFSYDPDVNTDGTKIVFQSPSVNLSPADSDTGRDVFLRDTAANTTTLVSRANGASGINANGDSLDASIDSAGATVSFYSDASNLGAAPPTEGGHVYVRDVAANTTALVSRASGASGAVADRGSASTAIAGDGTSVAFESDAGNLTSDSDDDFSRVFMRDLDGAQATRLVSRPTGSDPVVGAVNASRVGGTATVSADGRFVVFNSYADGLLDTPADDRRGGVYVRDVLTGATQLVSRASGPEGAPASDYSSDPSISGDGARVVFATGAILDPADDTSGEGGTDIYVRDLATSTTSLVSRAGGASGAVGSALSRQPKISADGRRVAFSSRAANFAADDSSSSDSIYVRDLVDATTTLVSRANGADGASASGSSANPAIDADGSRVAFETSATNLGDGDPNGNYDIHIRDLATGETLYLSRASGADGAPGSASSGHPSINADGTRVAFRSGAVNFAADNPTVNDIFLRDTVAATTVLVSATPSGPPSTGYSWSPSIDASGTRVAFASGGSNLVPGDTNQHVDAFLRDVSAGTTALVSRANGSDGAAGDGDTDDVALSSSGNCVAFDSVAANLVPDGYATADFSQVYLRVVRGECALPTPPGPGGGGGDVVAPVLEGVTLSAKRFVVGPAATATAAAAKKKKTRKTPVGTRFSWRLSEPALVTIRIERATSGRRKGRACVKPTKKLRKAKKCTLWLRAGTLTRQSAAGTTKLTFSGRIGKKALKPGSYRAVVSAVDAAGNTSAKRTVAFRVVKR